MLSEKAETHVQEWLNGPIDTESKQLIQTLYKDNPKELEDAFSSTLSFGTGGMRGLMGVGTNRVNIYTVQMATQGLANYLLKQPSLRKTHSVFISYDPRHHSKEFAMEAARVLAGNGIVSYLVFAMRPTPYTSFGVRQKECSAGIMITASHNPKEYNGYKVYWNNGSQVVAPHDIGIVAEVNKITSLNQVKIAPKNSPLIEMIDPEFDLEYLEAIKKARLDPKEDEQVGDQLKITYTPLHGSGATLVPKALKDWGFPNINAVEHQLVPDGDFPTVKSPNPEDPAALEMGVKQLMDTDSDLLIATDPDADRLAVVCNHNSRPFYLNGNQIAAICAQFICQKRKEKGTFPKNGAMATTIVSTDLLLRIAKAYEIPSFQVLTGFKYIGELIDNWQKDSSYTFLFGAEESYGYLVGTHSLDKDAVVMSCLIAEIALEMKIEGRTLVDFLEEILDRYGMYLEGQKVFNFPPGNDGMEKMKMMMASLRKNRPQSINGIEVAEFEDYENGLNGLPPSNVLLFRLADKSKTVVRPSGTEPKLKIYAGIHKPKTEKLELELELCQKQLEGLLNAVQALF